MIKAGIWAGLAVGSLLSAGLMLMLFSGGPQAASEDETAHRGQLNILELAAWAAAALMMVYILAAAILLFADRFSVTGTLVLALILLAGAFTAAAQRTLRLAKGLSGPTGVRGLFSAVWRRIRPDCNIRPAMPILLALLIALPLTAAKYGYYGMGQDEGVYETAAIAMICGDNALQKDFEEYQLLETEEDREAFLETISANTAILGAYNYDPECFLYSEDEELSDVSYVYHGIATYPAMLALFGMAFGLKNMLHV